MLFFGIFLVRMPDAFDVFGMQKLKKLPFKKEKHPGCSVGTPEPMDLPVQRYSIERRGEQSITIPW